MLSIQIDTYFKQILKTVLGGFFFKFGEKFCIFLSKLDIVKKMTQFLEMCFEYFTEVKYVSSTTQRAKEVLKCMGKEGQHYFRSISPSKYRQE